MFHSALSNSMDMKNDYFSSGFYLTVFDIYTYALEHSTDNRFATFYFL